MEEYNATPSDPSQQIDVQIRRAVQDCNKTSLEVLETLRLCQVGDSKGLWPTLLAMRSVVRLGKEIQARLAALESHKQTLSRLLDLSTKYIRHFASPEIQRLICVLEISLKVNQILRYLPRLQGNTKSNLKTLKRIEDQLQKLLTSSTSHELASSIETFQAVQKGFPRLLEHMYQQGVLASLRQQDATRGSRLNAMVRATSSTLNWVFASSATDRPGTRAKCHATFVSWLREGSGFYHFQGKPGSGKSTLMKSVVYNADTKSCLSYWAGDKPLCLASYFFWKPGSMLQKTIIGLVISLVYDIIESFPPLAEVAFPGHWDPESHHLDWLSKTAIYVPIGHDAIMEGFQRLITHQGPDHPKFCFFIDGLDEYDNTSEDMALGQLATLLQEWVEVSQGSMKICVASREYQDFSDMADKHHRIRIQDFTYRDIKQHVTSSLVKNKRFLKLQFVEGKSCRELIDKVADQAEGVFLWATLVLPRIHTALDDDFSIPRVLNIVEETPKKMEAFLDSILDNIKPEQQYKAHLLLAIVLRWKGYLLSGRYTRPRVTRLFSLDIAVLFEGLRISAELPDDLTSSFVLPDDVNAWLDRHTTNIVSCTNGLVSCIGTHSDGQNHSKEIQFNHRSIPEFLSTRLEKSCENQGHNITDDSVLMALSWILRSLVHFDRHLHRYSQREISLFTRAGNMGPSFLTDFFALMGLERETGINSSRSKAFGNIDSCSAALDRLWKAKRPLAKEMVRISEEIKVANMDVARYIQSTETSSAIVMAAAYGKVAYVKWRLRKQRPSSQISVFELNQGLFMGIFAIFSRNSLDIVRDLLVESSKEERLLATAEVLIRGASPSLRSHAGFICSDGIIGEGTVHFLWHLLIVKAIYDCLSNVHTEEPWDTLELFFKHGIATTALDLAINIEGSSFSRLMSAPSTCYKASLIISCIDSEGLVVLERMNLFPFWQETNVDMMKEIHCENQTHLQLRLPRHEDGSVRAGIQGWKLRDFITHAQPHNMRALHAYLDNAEDERWERIYAERERACVKIDTLKEDGMSMVGMRGENIVGFIDEDSSWPGITFVAMLLLWVSVFLHELAQEGFQVSF